MMNVLQMLMQQKIQQIPNGMMKNMEQQLKRVNPTAYKEYQEARKSNKDPNEFLNEIVNRFTPEQKQSWETLMNGINAK